ncbi:UNVERIFIED_CONTAM: protein sym-1 [Sesamum angustifolium]|uniref:Protein sym-1 n=1 Tax=Sesamum angustifolium TaxID=2727405 RepID=A0AAW2M7U5_9LAMI
MLRLWKWYQNCLATHPVKTQVISSGIIWGVGDIAAQAVTNSTAKRYHLQTHDEVKELKINWRRVATTTIFGLGFVGPVGHFWYEGLDRIIRVRLKLRPNSFRFVASKVAADGKTSAQVKEDVKRDFLPALILEGGVWPIVQVANFRFVPVRYQLLYVNFFCLLDSCFLSWIEQQEDAPWKQWFKSFLPLKEQEGQGG